jgi:hypothetical protein
LRSKKAFDRRNRYFVAEHDSVVLPDFSLQMKSGTRKSPRKSSRRGALSVVSPVAGPLDSRTTDTTYAVVTPIAKGGVACPFPWRLHEMLEYVHSNEMEHMVSWDAKGKAFTVHDPKAFVSRILPRYVLLLRGIYAGPRE